MWKEGSIKVNGEIFHYWMKQYEGGSHWGIEPADENTRLATELLLHGEN